MTNHLAAAAVAPIFQCRSGKIPYFSHREARAAVKSRTRGIRNLASALTPYRCADCGFVHLTSMSHAAFRETRTHGAAIRPLALRETP
jgi:hypothetical protein